MDSSALFLETAGEILEWAVERDFRGTDPYDGLNSRLLRPFLGRSRILRLSTIQMVKRCPVNLRPVLFVPPGTNPKGLALFLSGLGRLRKMPGMENGTGTPTDLYGGLIAKLEGRLLSLASRPDGAPAFSAERGLRTDLSQEEVQEAGAIGWGYDFPWQSRAFLQPAWFPTVVCSSFVLDSLKDSDSLFYQPVLNGLANFVLETLNLHESEQGICFSYSPSDDTRVYNASLFAAKILARASLNSGNGERSSKLRTLALRACEFVKNRQKADGSWVYGEASHWQWIDNLHTGFVLETLCEIASILQVDDYRDAMERGSEFYWNRLFEEDGTAKYYSTSRYPLDTHTFAQAAITLDRLGMHGRAETVLSRAIDLLWNGNRRGFIFQRGRFSTNRQIHMRWSQAWMMKALVTVASGREK